MDTTTNDKHFIFEGSKIDRVFIDAKSKEDAADVLLEMILASRISVHHITSEGDQVFIFRDEKEKDLWGKATLVETPDVSFPESAE